MRRDRRRFFSAVRSSRFRSRRGSWASLSGARNSTRPASAPVTLLTFAGIALVTLLPFTPLGAALDLAVLPAVYFAFLAALVAGYMALVTAAKRLYVRRWGELL